MKQVHSLCVLLREQNPCCHSGTVNLIGDRIRVRTSEPEPDPHTYSGAGTVNRIRDRIRIHISEPEPDPHSYSGAGTVHEKLTLSATIVTYKCGLRSPGL